MTQTTLPTQATPPSQPDIETALATIHHVPAWIIKESKAIEEIAARCTPEAIKDFPPMTQTLVLSKGMHDLQKAVTKELVTTVFMPLQGSKLGFRTDKDKDGGYSWEIVRDCMIEAMLRGLRPIGNEMNIIGGNCYATLESFERRTKDFPGLTDIDLKPGVPVQKEGGALVPFEATWKLNGVRDELRCVCSTGADGVVTDRRIPVRVNAGQIVDAILGKARRKMLARIFERISGVRTPVVEVDAIDTTGEVVDTKAADAPAPAKGPDAKSDELANRFKGKARAAKEQQAQSQPVDTTGTEKPTREPGEEG